MAVNYHRHIAPHFYGADFSLQRYQLSVESERQTMPIVDDIEFELADSSMFPEVATQKGSLSELPESTRLNPPAVRRRSGVHDGDF